MNGEVQKRTHNTAGSEAISVFLVTDEEDLHSTLTQLEEAFSLHHNALYRVLLVNIRMFQQMSQLIMLQQFTKQTFLIKYY